jgi:hypothetical protein
VTAPQDFDEVIEARSDPGSALDDDARLAGRRSDRCLERYENNTHRQITSTAGSPPQGLDSPPARWLRNRPMNHSAVFPLSRRRSRVSSQL